MQKQLSYLQNIGMDLLNWNYSCLHNTFYDIYILWRFRRLEKKTKTPHTVLISASHSPVPSLTLEVFVVSIYNIFKNISSFLKVLLS